MIAAASSLTAQAPEPGDAERAAKNKQIVLGRLKRETLTTRGDKAGQVRARWEWFDKIARAYLCEKNALLRDLSAGSKHELRLEWVYGGMKVTFEELFALGPESDEVPIPILSHQGLVKRMPKSSLEDLALPGKQGETNGPVAREHAYRSVTKYGEGVQPYPEYQEAGGKRGSTRRGSVIGD